MIGHSPKFIPSKVVKHQKPLFYLDRPGFIEHEELVRQLPALIPSARVSDKDFCSGTFIELARQFLVSPACQTVQESSDLASEMIQEGRKTYSTDPIVDSSIDGNEAFVDSFFLR